MSSWLSPGTATTRFWIPAFASVSCSRFDCRCNEGFSPSAYRMRNEMRQLEDKHEQDRRALHDKCKQDMRAMEDRHHSDKEALRQKYMGSKK